MWSEEVLARLEKRLSVGLDDVVVDMADLRAVLGETERLHTGLKRGSDWIRANLPDAENGAFVVDILLAEIERLRQQWDTGVRAGMTATAEQQGRILELQAEVERLRALLEANIPPRVYGSLQEEVDFLRRDVAALQANKHNLITRVGRAEAALGPYARLLVKADVLRRGGGGGQMMTDWKCGLCEREQLSPDTAHGILCDDCRKEVIARAALSEEGKP